MPYCENWLTYLTLHFSFWSLQTDIKFYFSQNIILDSMGKKFTNPNKSIMCASSELYFIICVHPGKFVVDLIPDEV